MNFALVLPVTEQVNKSHHFYIMSEIFIFIKICIVSHPNGFSLIVLNIQKN